MRLQWSGLHFSILLTAQVLYTTGNIHPIHTLMVRAAILMEQPLGAIQG